MVMKYCPKCQRTYADDTQSFCLQDGSTLVNSDPQAETFDMQELPQVPSHQVEMIHDKIILNLGNYFDLKTKYRTIRITFKDIVEKDFNSRGTVKKELAAQLHVSTGGGIVFGGEETIQHDINEYLVPVKTFEAEEPRSVFYFYTTEIQSAFFRVFLEHLNQHTKQAEVNIVYLHSRKN
jgi:hypothetical protein